MCTNVTPQFCRRQSYVYMIAGGNRTPFRKSLCDTGSPKSLSTIIFSRDLLKSAEEIISQSLKGNPNRDVFVRHFVISSVVSRCTLQNVIGALELDPQLRRWDNI